MKISLSSKLLLSFGLVLMAPFQAHCYYNPSTGRWLSRDPNRELGSTTLYCFSQNDPITSVDPDGRYTVRIASGERHPRQCGGWLITWIYELILPQKGTYFIVQEINKVRRVNDCCDGTAKNMDSHFYEAKKITAGRREFTTSDRDAMEPDHDTAAGLHLVSAEGRIFPADQDIANDVASWSLDIPETHPPGAERIPATRTTPTWWDTRFIDVGYRLTWNNDWNCCVHPNVDGTLHTIPEE